MIIKLGVALADRLIEMNFMEKSESEFQLSATGKEKLQKFGVEVERNPKSHRCFSRQCLGWSKRRYHLAGS